MIALGASAVWAIILGFLNYSFLAWVLGPPPDYGPSHWLVKVVPAFFLYLGDWFTLVLWREELEKWWKGAGFESILESGINPTAYPGKSGTVRPPAPHPPPVGLVAAGSIEVDRSRALEVLARSQFRDPRDCLLAWVRAAVLSGAKNIDFEAVPGGFEMRFDGEAVSSGQIQDPLGPLFADDFPGGEAGRLLAYGLLAARRLRASGLSLTSGGEGTVLRVTWGFRPLGALMRRRCMNHLRENCGMVTAELRVPGKPVPRAPLHDRLAFPFERDGVRLVLAVPGYPRGIRQLRLYRQGVLVENSIEGLEIAQADTDLNDDTLNLDASHSAVTRDERRARAVAILNSLIPRFIEEVSRVQAERYQAMAPAGVQWGGDGPFWDWEITVTNWLRDAADRLLTAYQADSKTPHLKALWETPLFLSDARTALSRLDLDRLRLRDGKILMSRWNSVPTGRAEVVWCTAPDHEKLLRAWFQAEFLPEDKPESTR